jgi:hypothetical protein
MEVNKAQAIGQAVQGLTGAAGEIGGSIEDSFKKS